MLPLFSAGPLELEMQEKNSKAPRPSRKLKAGIGLERWLGNKEHLLHSQKT